MESQRKEIEREKELVDAKSRALLLQLETKQQTMIREEQAKREEEKRKMIEFVVKNFKQLFDAKYCLNDECFRVVVQKVGAEYERLRNGDTAIRRLMSLSSGESIEDAVTKLMIVMYRNV
jgi:hypothetical protein